MLFSMQKGTVLVYNLLFLEQNLKALQFYRYTTKNIKENAKILVSELEVIRLFVLCHEDSFAFSISEG